MLVSSQMRSSILSFSSNSFEKNTFQTILTNPKSLLHVPLNQMTPNLINQIVELLFSSKAHMKIIVDDQSPHRNQFFNLLIQHHPKIVLLLAQFSVEDQTLLYHLNDLDFIKDILRKEISMWRYVPNHLKIDPSLFAFYKQLYMSDPINLQDFHKADLALRDDLDVGNWAVSNAADHYICLSLRLKDSEELLRKVIQTHPYLYEYASARLKNNQELAQIVFYAYPESYRFMSKNLIANHEFIMNLIVNDYEPNKPIGENFKLTFDWFKILNVWELNYPLILKNPIVQILFVRYRIDIMQKYLPQEIKNQRDFVKTILRFHSRRYDLRFVADQYRSDKEIVKIAIYYNEKNFDYISASLKNDPEVLLVFLRHCDDSKRVQSCLSSISQATINTGSILKLIAKKWPNEVMFQTKNVDGYLLQKIKRHQQKKPKS